MAKKLEKSVAVGDVLENENYGKEDAPAPERLEREIPCKAHQPLTIVNGNDLLFHDKGVESITLHFRGD